MRRNVSEHSVPVPGSGHSDEMLRSLLSLCDVMSTGHHAAVSARSRQGGVVAGWSGGPAPSRIHIPELLPDVLCETDLDGIANAYTAMDERRAIKSLVRVGSL